MPDALDDLTRLRTEIDRIDDTIVDLLVERMGHVEAIARAKGVGGGRLAIRPAREASILRRLSARAENRLPATAIVRVWREVIGVATVRQTPFVVIVQAPCADGTVMEQARSHFGMTTPLLHARTGDEALRALMAGEAKVAVLALSDPDDRWWASLQQSLIEGRYIFGRVPFVAATGVADAWLFGPVTPEPSGDDLSLIHLETGGEFGPNRLVEQLGRGGLRVRHLASARAAGGGGVAHLVEADGFFVGHEAALGEILAALRHELLHCMILGAYPRGLADRSLD